VLTILAIACSVEVITHSVQRDLVILDAPASHSLSALADILATLVNNQRKNNAAQQE